MATNDIGWLLLFGFLFALLYLALHSVLLDNRVARLFSKNETDEPDLQTINNRLFELNRRSITIVFSGERRANLSFRGKQVTLVYGQVASCSFNVKGGGSSNTRLFALAEPEQTEWMNAYPEVFQPALKGEPLSIFWVDAKAFEKQASRPFLP